MPQSVARYTVSQVESSEYGFLMTVVFKNIGVVGRNDPDKISNVLSDVVSVLLERSLGVMVLDSLENSVRSETDFFSIEEIGAKADLVVVVGGDGSLLQAARTLALYDTPVIGVNRGRLGFLADINPDDITNQLSGVLEGEFIREKRFLLNASVSRDNQVVSSADALNDVVVNSGTSAQMIELELYIDGIFVYRQRSDGLIVSSPTGSTAYSLSGGGPIMHPTLDAMLLVPMYPHALSSRPIVIDGNSEIRIDLIEGNEIDSPVTCDGQVKLTAKPGDTVHVRKKPEKLTLLHPKGHNFYASCRDKLRWSNALVG